MHRSNQTAPLTLARLLSFSLVVSLVMGTTAPAFAEDEVDDYTRAGFYGGVGVIGASFRTLDDQIASQLESLGYAATEVDPALGFEVYVGYRAHPNLAVEAEFELVPEFDIDSDSPASAGTLAETEVMTASVAAHLILPLGSWQPYATVGIGVMDAEVVDTLSLGGVAQDETDLVGRFGGGLDFYFTEHIVGRASIDYYIPGDKLHQLDYVSFGAGVQYRF